MSIYCPRCTSLCGPGQPGASILCRNCRHTVVAISKTALKNCPNCRGRYAGPTCNRCNYFCDACGQKKPFLAFPLTRGTGTGKRRGRGRICFSCQDQGGEFVQGSPTAVGVAADF